TSCWFLLIVITMLISPKFFKSIFPSIVIANRFAADSVPPQILMQSIRVFIRVNQTFDTFVVFALQHKHHVLDVKIVLKCNTGHVFSH
ncbi:MAG: hypothetical protein ACI8Y3_001679, partial [Paraglaciecola sp.]